ncbi:MBL fold metallo-hydrolase [Romboutsia weinsteinii]|uniref:MBL fold metallo-hydrolase n=1 Tax=Romboutsia weinsteinii TaxID=2020949 RepID=A0A371J3N8_9FIRM|nr:MBL fold metallo-hydrolase [Romboutsia weinsteinii]RDY27294.1 MBL fold metallo-hydrolase [Romboutsia weinsteinii]
MVITTLVENTTVSKDYKSKHGLCLHIKTKEHNILFDLGPDDTFIHNANKLNINIEDVDIVVISHGHKDHGGGLRDFLKINSKAKVYVHKDGFKDYYISVLGFIKYYIGLDCDLENNNRIVLTDDKFEIDNGISLVSNIRDKEFISSSNKSLLMKDERIYIQDEFNHEQNLIIEDDGKNILIAGCAHNGIINIVNKAEDSIGSDIDYVISGFHLYNPVSKKGESIDFIDNFAEGLSKFDAKFYTCHCTGEKQFNMLYEKLGDKINYLSTGQSLYI